MVTMNTVAELNQTHIGKRVRVQTMECAYVEGTLATIKHVVKEPYGKFVETWLAFEELTIRNGRENIYLPVLTYGNRTAVEIDE